MWCPSCGFENPPGFKFCGACGTSLIGQTRATRELAVDLRLALRSVLRPNSPSGRSTELATAITLYQAMEMTFWLPQAEAVLA